jgi:transcriptional regulator with XRE-family HTH domain
MAIRPVYQDFGLRVRDSRRRKKVTQDTLAREISLSRTSVTNIERGQQAVLLHQVYDIARALGTTVDELLPEDDRALAMSAPEVGEEAPQAVRRFVSEQLTADARGKVRVRR